MAPPVWPDGFVAHFRENVPSAGTGWNTGRWLYDWAARRSRFDHDDGQSDNFCQCAQKTDRACQLFFTNDTGLWVNVPETGACCRLCAPGLGCSTLKPSWLAAARYVGTETIGGRTCHTWTERGAVAWDYWSQTEDGVACQYRENIVFAPRVWHYLNFTAWDSRRPEEAYFALPAHCTADCPTMYPQCH